MHRKPGMWLRARVALGFVVLSLLIGTAGLVTVQAQKKVTDNPFLPAGNPFDMIRDGINTLGGKLDTIIKTLDRIAPVTQPGPVTLYTGLARPRSSQDVSCSIANVSDGNIRNLEIRIVTDHGFAFDRFTEALLVAGDSTFLGFPTSFSGMYRCEFAFEGSPDAVRATLNFRDDQGRDTVVLDAR